MRALLVRTVGGFKPACENSEKFFRSLGQGELVEIEAKTRNTRSVQWHRRYFGLLRLVYANTEQFKSEDEVHFYLKCETGTWDSMIVMPDGGKAYFVRSIAFDKMTAEEWPIYWERALDVLFHKILPGVSRDEALLEIERCAGYAR